MAEGLLTREPISDYGEFRVYLRPEREELVFEAFRERDGRAWLLRVPTRARMAIAGLLRDLAPLLARSELGPELSAAEAGVLRQVEIGPKDRLVAVLLEDGEDRAFALWRQEELRSGWSWTIDVVVVPIELAQRFCGLALQVIEQLNAGAAAMPQLSRSYPARAGLPRSSSMGSTADPRRS